MLYSQSHKEKNTKLMTGPPAYLSNGLDWAAFILIVVAILAGGCHHPRSKNDGDTTAISAGSQLSQTRVGKRVTIRGGLFRFKCGPGIQFDDGA
jgi:hypothetical protein